VTQSSHGHAVPRRSPGQRLTALLRLERSDILTLLAFALGVGLLSIVVPAAIEALVNTVAFGVLLWPVVVLSLVMCAFLALASVLRAMQTLVAEYLQRRLFVRTVEAFTDHFARAEIEAFDGRNPTDIVNRFFEVASAQKALSTLLVDGIGIVMITVVGLVVLSFYHPYLLTFALVMVGLVAFLLGHLAYAAAFTQVGLDGRATTIAAGITGIFVSGIIGQFFRQFAVTIAVSTLLSAFNSLTLSPALCALLLRPKQAGGADDRV
jgi:ABC-type bacteriocin/lantibiotic exporter with double-glycine peptidase domain